MNKTEKLADGVANADELFADWAGRAEAGEPIDFEELVRAYPAISDDLRRLHRDWTHFAPILRRIVPGLVASESVLVLPPSPGAPDAGDEQESDDLIATLGIRLPDEERYRFRGVLGRGGGGVVLKVWDTKLKRALAMKVVLGRDEEPRGGDKPNVPGRALARFVDEARIASQLNHPGIVPVHELGTDESGRAFFTMKLVIGDDLSVIFGKVQRGADGWNQTRALGVLLRVCEAMAYAHNRGVIHRDLKPANVMVGPYGEVHVMDWGLARVTGAKNDRDLRPGSQIVAPKKDIESLRKTARDSTPESPLVTRHGAVIGTPNYMSPEQARGRVDQLGPQSDIYSLGAMLYHLIAGEMPYSSRDGHVSQQTVVSSVISGPPRSLLELAPRAAAELIAICEKAMAPEIARRYANAEALAADVRSYLEGRVVRAYETGTWAETRKWVQRNKALATALAIAIMILASGVTVSTWLWGRATANANALWTMHELDAFRRNSSDAEFLESLKHPAGAKKPAFEWWLETASALVDGSPTEGSQHKPGLADYERALVSFRETARDLAPEQIAAIRAGYPRANELEYRQEEAKWCARMLHLQEQPGQTDAATQLAAMSLPTGCLDLNFVAFNLVRPDEPRKFGQEALAEQIAKLALAKANDPLSRARCLDTWAWTLSRQGEFDASLAAQAEALAEGKAMVRTAWFHMMAATTWHGLVEAGGEYREACKWETSFKGNMGLLKDERDLWHNDAEITMHAERMEDLQCIQREAQDWGRWRFDKPADNAWHRYMRTLVEDLRDLQRRIARAKSAATTPEACRRWNEAIDSIVKDPKYAFRRITPQLDLLPIGQDPDSKLWEFVHLSTGIEPKRGFDSKLVLTRHTGLVFVLLPPGRVTICGHEEEVDAFFLSKYEMTNEQWERATRSWPPRQAESYALMPVVDVSYDDCVDALQRTGAWLTLPSEAQWLYACRAESKTRFWSGDTVESLRGCEFLNFGGQSNHDSSPERVGLLRANRFGLHDMLGNAWEWCSSTRADEDQNPNNVRRDVDVPWLRVRGGGSCTHLPDEMPSPEHVGLPRWHRDTCGGLRPARPLTP